MNSKRCRREQRDGQPFFAAIRRPVPRKSSGNRKVRRKGRYLKGEAAVIGRQEGDEDERLTLSCRS